MATVNDVKSIIKGLLISTQKQLSLFDLCREFQLQEGIAIPFKKFGYNRLTDFLQSIPDTLQFEKCLYHGKPSFFMQPVVNYATQHMENFVQEQVGDSSQHRDGLRRPRAVSSHGSSRNHSSPPLCRRTRSPDNTHRGISQHHHEPRSSERAQSTVHSRLGPIPDLHVTAPTDHRSMLSQENTDPHMRFGPTLNSNHQTENGPRTSQIQSSVPEGCQATASAPNTAVPKANHTVTSGSLTTSTPTIANPKGNHADTSGFLSTTAPNTTIQKANHTATSGSLNAVPSTTKNAKHPKAAHNNAVVLQPCNALYIDHLFSADDEEEWELPPPCSCSISIHDLIKYVPLPQNMVDLLNDMCSKSVQEMMELVKTFGDEHAYSSGCRLHLLLQIRDLYEGEAKTLPTFIPGVANAPNIYNFPKPNDATSLQSLHGSKRKPGDAASTVEFPPPKPKVAKPSATVTSGTMTSSDHTASATPLSVNNSQPEAETTATQQQRFQAHNQLSQDFSKMMSKKLGLASDEASHPKPKIVLSDDRPENSTEKECCICIAKGRDVAFVPCGHAVCCSACSALLSNCPVCRKKIKTKLTLYFA